MVNLLINISLFVLLSFMEKHYMCLFVFFLFVFQIYELRVMETKPDKAVSIIECDMNVRPYFFKSQTLTKTFL